LILDVGGLVKLSNEKPETNVLDQDTLCAIQGGK
jgi:hypothetical protein